MRKRLAKYLVVVAALSITIGILDRVFPPDQSRYREASLEILARDGEPLRVFTTRDGMLRLATLPDDVDPRYLNLLLQVEDRHFWRHPGVDPLALARAVWQLTRHGHVVSGGSTLTMQVARLLSPHRHDVVGKITDIARAMQLEARFTKREILAMYLTLAPMGGNLEGVRSASRIYFDREPDHLSPVQAALLVAIPQSPSRLRPDRHPDAATLAVARICARTPTANCGDTSDFPKIMGQRPAIHAHHLADALRQEGHTIRVRTTLDAALQIAVEGVVAREARFLGDHANVSSLVIDNSDRSVLAYVGGSDYFGPAGMVDMVRAVRSPGSTLKPFIYGLAFDLGVLTPDTLVEDRPVRFGDYAPADFDGAFHGAVSAREALQQSYNAPAVQLLNEVGPGRLAATLRLAGVHLKFPHHHWAPALPLALGGVGITLRDLAMLYSGLAGDGRATPLRVLQDSAVVPASPLMTQASAHMIAEILRGTPTPDGVAPAVSRAIAYKTGTSYGFRDALALGYSGRYTVAVWVGRTDGTPRPGSYGRNTAAPLLFHIFDLLPPEPILPIAAQPNAGGHARRVGAALKRFIPSADVVSTAANRESPPRITFPPNGAHLVLARDGSSFAPLALEAMGGAPPYRWAVNGQPLAPAPIGAPTAWMPDGPGFVRISVTDHHHKSVTAEVWIE